jgi:hypothetical protein
LNKNGNIADIRYGAMRSRRLLIDAIIALAPFKNAITVVGAHAVHVWVQNAWGPIDMETTRDADVSINPSFVADNPKIIDALKAIGLEPALKDRPGTYGLLAESALPWTARTTFDILVPEAYAGGGRRAARIPGQKNAASRAIGLELSSWDRHLLKLTASDESAMETSAFVAGPAALLVAKAHKVHERLGQVATRPERLRPKDSGDVALLMMVSDPADVAHIMAERIREHPEIASVVYTAANRLVEMYADSPYAPIPRQHAADSLAARFDEIEVLSKIDDWLSAFRKEGRALFG